MHPTRWSAFFALVGLTALIPAYFIPAMLVANAVDGSRWLSVWSGIATFWERGHYFLAGVIFCFSLIFPLVKLALCLICSTGAGWLPLKFRRRVIHFTEWTAKYSMLDVFVIAMLILLVKVDEFILMLPSAGLYLFSFAVLCSAISSALLKRSFPHDDHEIETAPSEPIGRARMWFLPWLITGAAVGVAGLTVLLSNLGGRVDQVQLTNLTKRPIPRTMEKLMGLKEITKEDHSFWSKDTWKRLVEAFQAATTDSGWKVPQGYLVIETLSGKKLETGRQELHLDDPKLMLNFALPETLTLNDIASVELRSTIEFVGLIPAEASEERVAVNHDPFRAWTPDWYGRLFLFRWSGPANHEFLAGGILAGLGALVFYWAASGLLCGGRPKKLI